MNVILGTLNIGLSCWFFYGLWDCLQTGEDDNATITMLAVTALLGFISGLRFLGGI